MIGIAAYSTYYIYRYLPILVLSPTVAEKRPDGPATTRELSSNRAAAAMPVGGSAARATDGRLGKWLGKTDTEGTLHCGGYVWLVADFVM